MIPAKEKAKELVYKFYPNVQWKLGQEDCLKRAKNCALITVEEILNSINPFGMFLGKDYWEEVKQNIELL